MLIKYHLHLRISFFVAAFMVMMCLCFKANDFSILFSACFFWCLGSVLTFRSKSYKLFQIAYAWMVCFAVFQVFYFLNDHNTFLDKGGDDSYYLNDWIIPSVTDFSIALDEFNPYKTYVIPAALYFKFINSIGLDSVFSFHINLLNIFVASFIPIFVYRIAERLYNAKVAWSAALFTFLYPFFIYQCTKTLRDVYGYFIFTMAVSVLLSSRKNYSKILIYLILMFLVFNLRKEALVYFILLGGGFLFFSTKGKIIRITIVAGVLFFVVLAYNYISTKFGLSLQSISKFSELYDAARVEASAANSIATKLKNAGIAGKIISSIYNWMAPLPPPIVTGFSSMNLVISTGCLFWYYLFPRGVVQIWRNLKLPSNNIPPEFIKAFTLTLIVSSLFISYTSGEPRHLLIFLPVFSIFGIAYFQQANSVVDRYLNYASIVILLFGMYLYLYLKFILF